MKKLLVIVCLIWSTASNGQKHRLERICGIKETVVKYKLFNESETLIFNNDCLLASSKNDGEWREYVYISANSYDSVFSKKKGTTRGTAAALWKDVYVFDSLGRLSEDITDFGNGLIRRTNYYQDTTKRLLSTRIESTYTSREFRFFYETDQSKKYNKLEEYNDGKLSRMTVFAYDEKGSITREDDFFREDNKWVLDSGYVGGFPCSPCQFEYDSRGNWIKQYIISGHRRILYATRRIRYRK